RSSADKANRRRYSAKDRPHGMTWLSLTVMSLTVRLNQGRARQLSPRSKVFQPVQRPFVAHITRVQRRGWLEQEDLTLLLSYGTVFDPARHDQELALFEPDVPIAELHAEPALDHQEKFFLLLVVVPDKRALELDQLHLLAVEVPNHLRTPGVAEGSELL